MYITYLETMECYITFLTKSLLLYVLLLTTWMSLHNVTLYIYICLQCAPDLWFLCTRSTVIYIDVLP